MQTEIFTDMLLYRRVNTKDLRGNVVRIKRTQSTSPNPPPYNKPPENAIKMS